MRKTLTTVYENGINGIRHFKFKDSNGSYFLIPQSEYENPSYDFYSIKNGFLMKLKLNKSNGFFKVDFELVSNLGTYLNEIDTNSLKFQYLFFVGVKNDVVFNQKLIQFLSNYLKNKISKDEINQYLLIDLENVRDDILFILGTSNIRLDIKDTPKKQNNKQSKNDKSKKGNSDEQPNTDNTKSIKNGSLSSKERIQIYSAIQKQLEKKFSISFEKSRFVNLYNEEKDIYIHLSASKYHADRIDENYWYAYIPSSVNVDLSKKQYCVFAASQHHVAFLIPVAVMENLRPFLNYTDRHDGKPYWHIYINEYTNKPNKFYLKLTHTDNTEYDLSEYAFTYELEDENE